MPAQLCSTCGCMLCSCESNALFGMVQWSEQHIRGTGGSFATALRHGLGLQIEHLECMLLLRLDPGRHRVGMPSKMLPGTSACVLQVHSGLVAGQVYCHLLRHLWSGCGHI